MATTAVGDLSAHFSRWEFACKGAGHLGHVDHETVVSMHLIEHLEELRAIVGRPCNIVSGHRCEWWNRHPLVAGARLSEHVRGRAADLENGYATVAQAEAAGFTGIGNKGLFAIHVDVRPRKARWSY